MYTERAFLSYSGTMLDDIVSESGSDHTCYVEQVWARVVLGALCRMSVTTAPDEIKLIWCNRGSQCKYETTRMMTNHLVLEEI